MKTINESIMKKLFFALSVLAVATSASAADFADTSAPDNIVEVGLRFGITSSTVGADIPKSVAGDCDFAWKRGFSAGAVVDLNIRDFFSVRPGFFFENRSYDYTTVSHNPDMRALAVNFGRTHRNSFSVPVLASFHFNISNAVRWNVEAGPYFSFGLGSGKDKVKSVAVSAPEAAAGNYAYIDGKRDYYGDGEWQHRKFDCGFQIGTGVEIKRHYVVNLSYQRGLRNVSASHDNGWSMKNKGWTFAIGYKF